MIQFIIYKIGQFLVLSLSLKAAYKLAAFIATLQFLFSRKDRNIVKNNLRAAFPEKSKAEINKTTRQVFVNFGKYLTDFLRFEKIDMEFIRKQVKIEGLEHVDEALRQGKGIIIISAHLGNWEFAGAIMGMLGYKIVAVVLSHNDKKVSDLFNNQRQIKNMEVTTLGRAAYACLAGLKQNKAIALLADRDFTEHGVVIDFLNKKALIPKGAAAFHLKTGAPIIPAFLLRCKDDTFKFTFEPALKFNLRNEKEKDMEIIAKGCTSTIERYIKAYPEQWYMFRKYWLD